MALPEYGGTPQYWPSSQTTGTRKGTRTRSGLTPEQEAAAYTTGFGGLNPSTFGMVDPNAMTQLEEAFNTQVLGKKNAEVNALAAEYGGAPQGGGNQASLAALMRSQAALPFANLRYQNAVGGARMQANRAQETAMARYAALTQPAQTETWDESTTSTPMQNFGQNPYADLTPKFGGFDKPMVGAGGGGGGGQVGGAKGAAAQPQDWWSRMGNSQQTALWGNAGTQGDVNVPLTSGYAGLNPQAEATAALPPGELMSGQGLQTSGDNDFANTTYGNILRQAYARGQRVF